MKRALITGLTGQDGSYIAEFLMAKGYAVTGLARRTSEEERERIRHIRDRITIVTGDLMDSSSLRAAIESSEPDEVYNIAAQSHVGASFEQPIATGEVTALGPLRLIEAVRQTGAPIRFYQASSSEMFGKVDETPQNEQTRFHPRSPYGVAKVYAHMATVNYRESYGMYAVGGILFNHESPRRPTQFVTRKVTDAVARIAIGLADHVDIGNIEARRDWGFAGDYVVAMWAMLQRDEPEDYVIGSGSTHSVAELCERAFAHVGIDWRAHVRSIPALHRPAEVDLLQADASKAKREIGWTPQVNFEAIVSMMVEADLARWREAIDRGAVTPKK